MKQPWNPQMKENISVPPCVIGCWTLVLSRDVILWDVCVHVCIIRNTHQSSWP